MIEIAILLSLYHPNQRGNCSGREKAGTNCPWKGFRTSPICGDNRHASPSFLGTGDDDHDDDGDDDHDQGGRTWQPFVWAKMAMKIFVKRLFTIFATNASCLHVIANLQI